MYIPPSNAESRPEVLHDFMDAHPFATLVTASSEGLFATHLPLVLDRTLGSHGTLQGHVARANPHWRSFESGREALVMFQGPHAYISPRWYTPGNHVPTWSYTAVHVYGTPRLVTEPAELVTTTL